MALSGRFVVLVALGSIPLILLGQRQGAAILILSSWIAVCLVLGGLDLALAASPRPLALERTVVPRVRLGEHVSSELTVTNTGTRRLRGRLRDGWEPSAGPESSRIPLDVPAGERRRVLTTLTPSRRGERRTEHVTVRSWGPLGLCARQATLVAPGRIRVLPPFDSRKHLPSRLKRLRDLDGSASVMLRGEGTEFDSLRPYVEGDDARSIDWRAMARRRDVVVRTWRPERDRRIVVVIDTSRTSAARIGDEPRLDTALESTLLLAALASRAGDRVSVVAFDRTVRGRVRSGAGPGFLAGLIDTLSLLDSAMIEMDWDGVPAQVGSLTSQRSLVVLVTALESPGVTADLLAVLPALTRLHTVVVASVTDPSVMDTVHRRDDREAVYYAAAAERALLDSERAAAAVRRIGADVVLGAPERLPPALADRYLALKAAGRL